MYAREVHKLMRRRFVPFLHEHGFSAERAGAGGSWTRVVGDDCAITLGYSLGVGCWQGVGGELELVASVQRAGRTLAWLRHSGDLLEGVRRERYRAAACELLARILDQDDLEGLAADLLQGQRDELAGQLARTQQEPDYLPPWRYQHADDVVRWCRLVAPAVPEMSQRLERVLRNSETA
jgi:hypothetical protein